MRLWMAFASIFAVSEMAVADPFSDALLALRSGDLGTGAAMFDALARGGDGGAMYNLAVLYHQGIGFPQNGDMALYWAWRARLMAVPRATALVDRLMIDAPKDRLARLHDMLLTEAKAAQSQDVAEAARNFIRLALIEERLAAKPDRVQIYAWYSLSTALGFPAAAALRDKAYAALTPKEAQGAEARAMAGFSAWCVPQAVQAPGVCAVLADNAPVAESGSG